MSSLIQDDRLVVHRRRSFLRSLVRQIRIYFLDRRDLSILKEANFETVRDRQQELVRFYSHYEDLVETLIGLAHGGPTASLENRYQAMRAWMLQNYPTVRQHVVAYLRFDPTDAEQSLKACGSGADAFEALFFARSLEEFVALDDGRMISRIARTRDALTLYGHHLRQLASKS